MTVYSLLVLQTVPPDDNMMCSCLVTSCQSITLIKQPGVIRDAGYSLIV